MTLKVNFTDVSDRGPAKPNGWYKVKVTDGEVRTTKPDAKNPNLEYMQVEFTVQEGPYAGQKFWSGMHLMIENALGIVKGFLKATGRFTQQQLDGELEFESWEHFLNSIKGSDLLLRNKQREWDGDMTDNVAGFKPLEDGTTSTGQVNAQNSLLP